jgi:hypothetical protein
MESQDRYFRRRAREELDAARRAVTPEARKRRLDLAHSYLSRLGRTADETSPSERAMFEWPLPRQFSEA